MPEIVDICSLDYLIGTLATAYKGLITSLVAKNFCMTESEGKVTLKGTILAMPEGSYRAFLMQGGIELARAGIRDGFFEILVDGEKIRSSRNLQIDIVQKGNHIGTFLLNQEQTGGMYRPALEIADDLKGVNFHVLTGRLKDKPGLFNRAEDIISKVFSTKKDWRKFSEEINSFAKDLFWSDREAFYQWYGILTDYSHKAAEAVDSALREKPVENFLFLIELPLENESDKEKLQQAAAAWLRKMKGPIELSRVFSQTGKILTTLHSRVPDADLEAALRQLLHSLKGLSIRTPAMPSAILDTLRQIVPESDLSRLAAYSEEHRESFLANISRLESLLNAKRYPEVLAGINETDFSFSHDTEMTDIFFAIIEKNIRQETASKFSGALTVFLPFLAALTPEAYKSGVMNIAGLIRYLIRSGLATTSAELLDTIDKAGAGIKEDVLLNREIAASICDGGSDDLAEQYSTLLKQIVVPFPEISGFSADTWAEIVPVPHLERLTAFLAIICLDSIRFRTVLVHLICNLSVTGVFVPDEKLFQREVSSYLNSAVMEEDFLLHYILLKKMPVFFNEIGASGKIRDYTTEIDSWGNDAVLYFLRKQVHVNASNHNIDLVDKIIQTWLYGDPGNLKDVVPDEILEKLDLTLLKQYSVALRPFLEALKVFEGGELHIGKLHSLSEEELKQGLMRVPSEEEIRNKILLLCRIYRELAKKYSLAVRNDSTDLSGCAGLRRNVAGMEELYKTIISAEKTVPLESLYFKRHIAFGIPSVIGTYHEPKFDALAAMIRTGEMTRLNIEKIISSLETGPGSLADGDFREWISCLAGMRDLFRIYGLANFQVDEIVTVLRTNRLFISQVIDLLRIWQGELTAMVKSLSSTFYKAFSELLKVFAGQDLPEFGIRLSGHGAFKTTDVYIRDVMSSVAGFIELDRLLEKFLSFSGGLVVSGRDYRFTPGGPLQQENDFFVLDDLSEEDAMTLSPVLGGKAKNLVYLKQQGLDVPAGVVFSAGKTGHFRQYTSGEDFIVILKKAVRQIEDRTGTRYGSPVKPLFLSVRSGSYISMPGIMSSILFCGMNKETVKGFMGSGGNERLAYDSYRRFLEHFGVVVYDLDEKFFDDILLSFLNSLGKRAVKDLSAGQMEMLVALYRSRLTEGGMTVPEDVYEQLRLSVSAVYRSWSEEKALRFRSAMDISEHWGTSVVIMQMIFGNEENSGASVFFTRRPHSMEKGIYGDTVENATGVDLVNGKLVTLPLARQQALRGRKSLEEIDPRLFSMHEDLALNIERAMKGLPQEVEATYTTGPDGKRRIYVLQTKRMEIHRGFTKRFQDVCKMYLNIIGRGVGVNGGALSGVATFSSSPEHIRELRRKSRMPVIVLRAAASTDDVSLMPEVDGIITITGGVSSHASILAQKFDLTAIVGCTDMHIYSDEKNGPFAKLRDYPVKEGAIISIDGSTGLVYYGSCESIYWERYGER